MGDTDTCKEVSEEGVKSGTGTTGVLGTFSDDNDARGLPSTGMGASEGELAATGAVWPIGAAGTGVDNGLSTGLGSENSTCTPTKDQLQCFVPGKLDVLRRSGSVSHHSRVAERQQRSARARTTYSYEVDDTGVCKVVFADAHNISEWTLKTLQANLAQDIVCPPRHRSEGTMPWNALPADEVEEVKMFIQNNATVNGLPRPTALRGNNKQAPTYLPCDK